MGKTVKKPEVRKQELVDIALAQFMEKGYEKTSIRSIVGQAGGEVGMFYHYFDSKEAIFQAVLEQYNADLIAEVTRLAAQDELNNFEAFLAAVLSGMEQSFQRYSVMQPQRPDVPMLLMLHQATLRKVLPLLCELLERCIAWGEILKPTMETRLLGDFLLYGMSAILHDDQVKSMEDKQQAILALYRKLVAR